MTIRSGFTETGSSQLGKEVDKNSHNMGARVSWRAGSTRRARRKPSSSTRRHSCLQVCRRSPKTTTSSVRFSDVVRMPSSRTNWTSKLSSNSACLDARSTASSTFQRLARHGLSSQHFRSSALKDEVDPFTMPTMYVDIAWCSFSRATMSFRFASSSLSQCNSRTSRL